MQSKTHEGNLFSLYFIETHFRRQILAYFGEDPRSIAPRPNCCDNCTLGQSAWLLSDLYEGVTDDGIYDFGRWARIVMSAVRDVRKSEKLMVIGYLKRSFLRNPFAYAANDSVRPYFWEAVIEQLRISGLLKITYVPTEGKKDDAMLELTESAKEWLESSHPKLELKAVGLMYAFFTKKGNAPSAGQAAISKSFKFVCVDDKFKHFLYEVRNVLAAAYDVLPFQVMKDDVIEKIVRHKPSNLNEFKMQRYEGFNVDRLERYAPTLVNAIRKYRFYE